MKTIKIYTREITERGKGGWYKVKTEYHIIYNKQDYNNVYRGETLEEQSKRIRKPFELVFETRSKKRLQEYIKSLYNTQWEQSIKQDLKEVIAIEESK